MSDRQGDRVRDTELVALQAGLKPAIRLSAPKSMISELRSRYQSYGFHVVLGGIERVHSGQVCHHLYVAPSAATAERLRVTEEMQSSLRGPSQRSEKERLERDFGLQLGYPTCCVEAFQRRVHLRTTEGLAQDAHQRGGRSHSIASKLVRRFGELFRPPVAPQYHHVVAAWVPKPEPRLNIFRVGEGFSLISFEPCTFACPKAVELADAIARALGAQCAQSLAELDGRLVRSVALAPGGERCELRLCRNGATVVQSAEAIPLLYKVPPSSSAEALARGLVGAEVGENGAIAQPRQRPVIVLAFAD